MFLRIFSLLEIYIPLKAIINKPKSPTIRKITKEIISNNDISYDLKITKGANLDASAYLKIK